MVSIATDRLDGLSSSTAMKGPVRVATTASVTHSGLPVIDGVQTVENDRILDKNSTGATRGIWIASTGAWRRSRDFSRTDDVRKGTMVFVTDGTVNAGNIYYVSTNNPITIDTTSITFTLFAA